MTHGSLFSGIGGFDLAAEWMGWENKFHCEWNEFGQKVLHYYWPNAELFTDITKSDFTKYANKIDVLTGGFPCQPYSQAGKRLGKEDDRHLWPEMLRAIREIKPSWVVGENVYGLVNWNGGLVFHEVQADLEAEGYEVWPFLLPAAAVNAPHRRDRIWFVAHSKNNGWNGRECKQREGTEINQRQFCEHQAERWDEIRSKSKRHSKASDVTNSNSNGLNKCNSNNKVNTSKGGFDAFSNFDKSIINGYVTNSLCKRYTRSTSNGIQKMERFTTQQYAISSRGSERNNWLNFPTVSPICDGDDGISDRLDSITFSKWRRESIKAGGNAIVPQVVYQIFKAIEQYEHQRPSHTTNR
jgi:DNA (cytosine-5)-methyltransferase 1